MNPIKELKLPGNCVGPDKARRLTYRMCTIKTTTTLNSRIEPKWGRGGGYNILYRLDKTLCMADVITSAFASADSTLQKYQNCYGAVVNDRFGRSYEALAYGGLGRIV